MTNEKIIRRLYNAMNERDEAAVRALLAEDFVMHREGCPAGAEGFFAAYECFYNIPDAYFNPVLCFGSGNAAAAYTKAVVEGKTVFRTADRFRLEGGKVTEAWVTVQPVR